MSDSVGDKIASSKNLHTKAPSQIAYEIDEAVATATALAYEMAAQIAENFMKGEDGINADRYWEAHRIMQHIRAASSNHAAMIAAWKERVIAEYLEGKNGLHI